jgi:hypothetical protein
VFILLILPSLIAPQLQVEVKGLFFNVVVFDFASSGIFIEMNSNGKIVGSTISFNTGTSTGGGMKL